MEISYFKDEYILRKLAKKILQIQDICFKKTKEGRVYLVSDCVLRVPRKSRLIHSNHNKTADCLVCGKKCTTSNNSF